MEKAGSSILKKRILWIDYAKFICICSVVAAHQTDRLAWTNFISAFALPTFFFLSGFLFSFKKFDSYSKFLKARVNQLVVPYFLLNLITYTLWLIFFRNFDAYFATDDPWYTPFFGIFYGNGTDNNLIHCIASWFIICLFVVENIYFLLFRNVKQLWTACVVILAIFICCIFDRRYDPVRWPWSLNIALIGVIFYAMGNLFKVQVSKLMEIHWHVLALISSCCLVLIYYVASINYADMNDNEYQNLPLFICGAFIGILFIISLSRVLEVLMGPVSLFLYIGQNTLVILAFHLMVMSLVRRFFLSVLEPSPGLMTHNAYVSPLIVASTVLMCIPLIHLFIRYLPITVGTTRKKNNAMISPGNAKAPQRKPAFP
ncbi:acyltransferase family protein [Parapedobacter sp. DT-150]|uniref:acyltransferase family protein n=1 Tax=Parapedobacter sp. DT-150 TaxID=3396162 RepID=UPI003F1BF6F2